MTPPLRLVRTPDIPGQPSTAKAPAPGEVPGGIAARNDAGPDISATLEDVVRRFGSFMRRTAQRHKLGASEIDEIMQESRIRLWKTLGTSERIQRVPASYIYRTVSTAALDFLRRRTAKREDSLEERLQNGAGEPADSRDADTATRNQELQDLIMRAVELLVESRRSVVRMHLAGYDREEIQELLGWSEAKTRNLLYRGLADVRTTLAAWDVGPGGIR